MDSAIAPDRHSASVERVDSSSVLVAMVSYTRKGRSGASLTARTGNGALTPAQQPASGKTWIIFFLFSMF